MPNAGESPASFCFHDPRTRGFRARCSVDGVVAHIRERVRGLGSERIAVESGLGRVLGGAVTSAIDVPHFDRAAMDGYALRAEETFGANAYGPAGFRVIGRSRPGSPFLGRVGPGEAVAIATGAPMPEGADAVVPFEWTSLSGELVSVLDAVTPARHVGARGEDIRAGSQVLGSGRVLRPQDLGVLRAIGMDEVEVVRRPLVHILTMGDELQPAGQAPGGFRIADANAPMLSALVARDGGVPVVVGPLVDDRAEVAERVREAIDRSDAVLICGGSSAGPEDYAPSIVAELGALVVHGVGLRPASPTGLGFVGGIPILLAPGNPVSCLCAYDFFGCRIVRRLGGLPESWPYRAIARPLAEKLVSVLGRVDYCRVRVANEGVIPITSSGASILSSTTRADGFVVVPGESEGYASGTTVTVWMYDT